MSVTSTYAALAAMEIPKLILEKQFSSAARISEFQAGLFKGTPLATILKHSAAACDVTARAMKQYERRPFDIDYTVVGDKEYQVREEVTVDKPFMRALNFRLYNEDGTALERNVPKVLLVAPMSGHFSTLLRGTVKGLLPHADITITDWKNARNIPLSAGRFDLGDYQQYLIEMMQTMGRDTHVIGVCQPTVPLLAAVSQMAADDDAAQPLSMTLMGGPIHPSANVTQPVQLAKERPMSFFQGLIGLVPYNYDGRHRPVYPGFLQLAGFMTMNMGRHIQSHHKYFDHLTAGDGESAANHREFYDEYMAVMDMTAEFYLETIQDVFKNEDLAHGRMILNGKLIEPALITKTALMTVEGTKDDISAPGQCIAAHRLCASLPDDMKFAHLEEGAGHYGIFNGKKFENNIALRLIGFMRDTAAKNGIKYDQTPSMAPTPWHIARARDYKFPVADRNDLGLRLVS